MKHVFLTILIGLILSQNTWSQIRSKEAIQLKIIDGVIYALKQKESSPKDILIIRTTFSQKYYVVNSFNGTTMEAKEVIPPNLNKIIDSALVIGKDSIADILWIKNKEYQSIILTDSEIPFKKLNSRFKDEIINALKSDIKILKDKAYFEEITLKYGNIRTIEATSFDESILQAFKNIKTFSVDIKYPQQAREYGTQGQVKIGYVMRKNCDIEDIYVFQPLANGCTESVIKSVMEMSIKLKEANQKSAEDILFIVTINFVLNG